MPYRTSGSGRLRADRAVLLTLLGALAALCWAYLLFRFGRMAPVGTGAALHAAPYRLRELGLLYALWVAVVAAMMLPAAAPSVLFYARVRRARARWVYLHALLFILGCVYVWCCAAATAALAGWLLHDIGALDESMAISTPTVGALALAAAGVYQWTPAKHACLDNGRNPLAFVLTHWRNGPWGAFRMGVTDACYCVGCCWLMMLLVLPAGVLNLPVIGGLVALILAEKLLPGGHVLACATGLGLVAWGTALLFP